MNPHERIAHKILSLARLPIPTLPRVLRLEYVIKVKAKSQRLFLLSLFYFFLLSLFNLTNLSFEALFHGIHYVDYYRTEYITGYDLSESYR